MTTVASWNEAIMFFPSDVNEAYVVYALMLVVYSLDCGVTR